MGLEIKDDVQQTTTETGSVETTTSTSTGNVEAKASETNTQAEDNGSKAGEDVTKTEIEDSKGSETSEGNDGKSNNDDKSNSDFDYSKYEEEFLSDGDLSEESKGELYKLFPKNLVDNYLANLQQATAYALAESEKKAFDLVGGEDNYKSLMGWASTNLDQDEKDAFNEAVGGSNEKIALQAIKGLQARMELAQKASKKPDIVLGNTDVVTGDKDVFLSRQDYANAIAKPEYQTSPQYRAEVDAKLARTLKNGGYKA